MQELNTLVRKSLILLGLPLALARAPFGGWAPRDGGLAPLRRASAAGKP